MTASEASLLGAVVALLLSVFGTNVIRRQASRWKLIDLPTSRSSHSTPTPRGGGLGLLFGFLGGVLILRLAGTTLGVGPIALLLGCLPVAAVGLWDDFKKLGAMPRLVVHVIGASVFVWLNGGLPRFPLPGPFGIELGVWGGVIAVIWIVGVINFFNFMDGIDGLAAGQAIASALGVALAGWSGEATALAVVLVGACAGFLIHNWSPARIFLGDVGSGTLGFL